MGPNFLWVLCGTSDEACLHDYAYMSSHLVFRIARLLLTSLSASGCSFILPSTPHSTTSERFCAPLRPTVFHVQGDELSADTHDADLPLSEQSIEVAKVMNVLPSKQEFRHERNLLNEVWQNPKQSSVFSPAIWRFLLQRHNKDQAITTREEIIRAWLQRGRLGESGSPGEQERTALIFGPGGTYASTDLRARASMLETLEAHINLLSEELEAFLREITQQRVQRTPQEGPLS
jgi:hypothetical protein